MKLEQCYNYLFQKYNIFSNQKHRDEDNSYIFNHAQIDLWSKRENSDKVDKDEPSNIKKLSNKLRQQLYIYNSCCRRRNGEDLAGKTQTGKIYAGQKNAPADISLRPSKELDSQWTEASEAVSFQKGENMERNRKALGRYAKSKGKRGEREVANMLKAAGFTAARRTAQFCGKTGDASDVMGLPGYHIEVKYVEKLNLWNAVDQAARDSAAHQESTGEELVPIVFFRKRGRHWLVCLDAEKFLALVKTEADHERADRN